MTAPDGLVIDHINQNKLDNRRSNLRFATKSQNGLNSKLSRKNKSGHRGVSWHGRGGKWQVHIVQAGKRRYLGLYSDVNEAARVYSEAVTNSV